MSIALPQVGHASSNPALSLVLLLFTCTLHDARGLRRVRSFTRRANMKRLIGCGLLVALVAIASVAAFAQGSAESSVRGNLSGLVVDSSGAVVPGAKVTITGQAGGKSD